MLARSDQRRNALCRNTIPVHITLLFLIMISMKTYLILLRADKGPPFARSWRSLSGANELQKIKYYKTDTSSMATALLDAKMLLNNINPSFIYLFI